MNARVFAVFFWLASATLGLAQGYAGLGTQAEGFAEPDPDLVLQFPRDHGAHPEFRIEWWYVTANLQDAEGRDYGIQWTLFRSALAPHEAPGWQSPQLWMGHAGLTTPAHHFVSERLARGGIGQAGAQGAPFMAWIDDWQLASRIPEATSRGNLGALVARARGADFAYDLRLDAQRPLVLQGVNGYSVKSASGRASHYYSQPFYQVEGQLELPQGKVAVSGQAWLDREWSSQPLSAQQKGWDWVSLHFEDGAKLMGFQLRQQDGTVFTSGTWIGADGVATPFSDGQLEMLPQGISRVAGRDLPGGWRVRLPAQGVDVVLEVINPQAWMETGFPYWEGPVRISGSHAGRGYLEMTGY